MNTQLPSRDQVILMIHNLIEGKLTPEEVQRWASAFLIPEYAAEYEKLHQEQPALTDLIDGLAMCAEKHDGTAYMYSKKSYEEWLSEFYDDEKFYESLLG